MVAADKHKEIEKEETASGKGGAGIKIESGTTPVRQRTLQDKYKALIYIQKALTEEIFVRLMNCTSTKQAWEIIKNEYGGTEQTKISTIVNLRTKFETLRMGKDETIRAYADRIIAIVNKLKLYGDDEFTERKIVMNIITTLPQRFEMNILALEGGGKNMLNLTLAELLYSLHASKQRAKNKLQLDTEGAMYAKLHEALHGNFVLCAESVANQSQ
ncbi:hypothetical protein COLO4_08800 [Corchorus olitorius]|uniref:Uncharacterized protein n=1 Tax=Corchorus olitorius TaxID=93759 RepID=A0A1R3KEK0_9ROSI|nr:hypothetical protein COLO4_08800 [Corchorus olitorius]